MRARLLFAVSLASLVTSCSRPGHPPRSQPAPPRGPAAPTFWPPQAPPPGPQPPPRSQPGPSPHSPPPNGDRYAAARRRCFEETNAYRARVGAPPVVYRHDRSACTDVDARGDALRGTVHGGEGQCGIGAQNECPGWGPPADAVVAPCLKSMFDEGPGTPYSEHGHYINMTNREYTGVACGFFEHDGKIWLVQNFFH